LYIDEITIHATMQFSRCAGAVPLRARRRPLTRGRRRGAGAPVSQN
jgi:hypothetical protein